MLSQSFVFALPILPRISLNGDFIFGGSIFGTSILGAVNPVLIFGFVTPTPDTPDARPDAAPDALDARPDAAPVTLPPDNASAVPETFDARPDAAPDAPDAADEIPPATPDAADVREDAAPDTPAVSWFGSGIFISGISGMRFDILSSSPNGMLLPNMEKGTIAVPSIMKSTFPASIGDISST